MAAISVPYLGKPTAMRTLPSPNGPVTASLSRQDVTKTLLSGGVAVIGRLNARKTYSLPYEMLDATSADTLLGFYTRLYGVGPFVFVDPSVRNVLSLDVSTVGLRSNASPGWVASAGALGVFAANGPVGVDTAALVWSSLTAGATLQPGSTADTADIARAPVYLAPEQTTVSLYAKASAATSATLELRGYTLTGAVGSSVVSVALALTTTWQRFTVTAAAGALGGTSAFLLPRVVLGASVPTSVSIAAAQLEYAGAASAWQPGFGSPRVLPTATPGREVQQTSDFSTNYTFVLGEI